MPVCVDVRPATMLAMSALLSEHRGPFEYSRATPHASLLSGLSMACSAGVRTVSVSKPGVPCGMSSVTHTAPHILYVVVAARMPVVLGQGSPKYFPPFSLTRDFNISVQSFFLY